MKKIIVRIGIVIVLLLLIGLAVAFFSLDTIVKKGVETVGPKLTKVDITLGSVAISPFSGSGKLSKLFVGNPEGYKTASAMELGSIEVGVQISSVTSDTIVVNEINIQSPNITLEGTLKENNLTKILDNLNAATASGESTTTQTSSGATKPAKKFIVKDLVIDGGQINLQVTVLGQLLPIPTLPLPPLHLQNIGTAEGGVTAAQLSQQIMKPLLANITSAAAQAISSVGGNLGNLGKQGSGALGNATKSLGNLFNSKQ